MCGSEAKPKNLDHARTRSFALLRMTSNSGVHAGQRIFRMDTLSYHDFRGFVEEAKKISEWRLIEGADWDNEIGALIESTASDARGNPDAGKSRTRRAFASPCTVHDSVGAWAAVAISM